MINGEVILNLNLLNRVVIVPIEHRGGLLPHRGLFGY